MEVVVTAGGIRCAKLQLNHDYQQTQMSFLSPSQQCQSTEGISITFHGLDHSKITKIFDFKKCHYHEIWVRGHLRSLKVQPFDRLCVVSYYYPIVTLSVDIQLQKCRDL